MERKQKQRKVWVHLTKTCLIALATIFLAAVLSNGETGRKFETLNKIQGRFSFVVIGDTRSGGDDYSELVKRYLRKIVNGVMHVITGGGALLYTNEEKGGFCHFILVTV